MPSSAFDLTGRAALVTGGGSGLGFAIARGLAQAGAKVTLNGRNAHKLETAAAQLAGEGLEVDTLPFDVTDEAQVDASLRNAPAFDILVNNAAVANRQPLEAFSLAQWRAANATNVDGPFLVTRALLPAMKSRRAGKIINICSLASDLGRPNIVAYATAKGALRMFTRALAVELAPYNVQVNGIAPGFFKTDMNAPLLVDERFSEWVVKRTPAGRWGDPPEVAGAAVFLASSSASYVTGHILHVDGGFAAAY
ncbi:MAG TPA: glucose 1-dehydrogenase [Casimicrobiaceae bacterium]|nr:glucose 1-dehydrogenase [Casimicrobiaceae bacterium]